MHIRVCATPSDWSKIAAIGLLTTVVFFCLAASHMLICKFPHCIYPISFFDIFIKPHNQATLAFPIPKFKLSFDTSAHHLHTCSRTSSAPHSCSVPTKDFYRSVVYLCFHKHLCSNFVFRRAHLHLAPTPEPVPVPTPKQHGIFARPSSWISTSKIIISYSSSSPIPTWMLFDH